MKSLHDAISNNASFDDLLNFSGIEGLSIIHKFGYNAGLGSSLAPICSSGFYRTPTALTDLEIVSDNVADTAAGAGGRKVTVQGLTTDWALVEEEVTLLGTTAVPLANQYYRVFRAYVSESGTYATQSSPSHLGALTIQESGGGDVWAVIDTLSGFGLGQTQIGVYTVPAGHRAWVKSKMLTVESTKVTDLFMFQRPHCDVVSPPYTGAMRVVQQHHGVGNQVTLNPDTALGPFTGPCDIGFMASVATGSASASVDFEILLQELT